MNLLGILVGVLGVATVVCLWRIMAGARELNEARKAEGEARAKAEEASRETRAAQREAEERKKETAEALAERTDLKKKLYDAKEEMKRRQGTQRSRDDVAAQYEARLRDMNHELSLAREAVEAVRPAKQEADKVLGEVRMLREKVASLESQLKSANKPREPREPRPPREPVAPPPPIDPNDPAAVAVAAATAAEVLALKKKLGERDFNIAGLRRRLDNANRIYVVTQAQLEIAQEKLAMAGWRYAELLAKHEGRAAPTRPEPSPAQDAAAEAQALAAAQDDSEPVIPEAPPAPAVETPATPG